MLRKLEWMTDADYENILFHWGCVCDYENVWGNDYEGWCKRILNNTPRYQKDWKD